MSFGNTLFTTEFDPLKRGLVPSVDFIFLFQLEKHCYDSQALSWLSRRCNDFCLMSLFFDEEARRFLLLQGYWPAPGVDVKHAPFVFRGPTSTSDSSPSSVSLITCPLSQP